MTVQTMQQGKKKKSRKTSESYCKLLCAVSNHAHHFVNQSALNDHPKDMQTRRRSRVGIEIEHEQQA